MPATGPILSLLLDGVTTGASLVAAVTGKKIRLRSLVCSISADGSLQFVDDAGTPVKLTGAMLLKTAGVPFVLPDNPEGWGDTTAGQALKATIVGGGHIDGVLSYQLVN